MEALPASPLTNGQGYSYGGTILRDVKLNLADSMPFAHDGGALVDHISGLLMPGQVPARLRTLVSNYLSTLPESMISSNSSWKYFTDATGLGGSDIVVGHASYTSSNWKHPDFVDTSWTDGNAVLGYSSSNSGITSILPFGPDAALKWRAAYFRKEFQVTDAANVAGVTLRLKRDDGAVVYINGREARRDNFNAGVVVTGTTLATGAGDNGAAFFDYAIPPSLLVEGRNVIAVEVHQNSNTSSDLFFDVEVKASRNGTPAFNLATPDRVQRLTEALYLLSLSPEFALQN